MYYLIQQIFTFCLITGITQLNQAQPLFHTEWWLQEQEASLRITNYLPTRFTTTWSIWKIQCYLQIFLILRSSWIFSILSQKKFPLPLLQVRKFQPLLPVLLPPDLHLTPHLVHLIQLSQLLLLIAHLDTLSWRVPILILKQSVVEFQSKMIHYQSLKFNTFLDLHMKLTKVLHKWNLCQDLQN